MHITAKSPTCLAAPGSCTPITETTVGATTIERLAPVGNTLPFKIHGAEPGTWEISVNEPAHIDVFGASVPVTKLVNPGPTATEVPGFDMSLVTLGSLSLALTDGNGTAITTAPTIELDGTTYPSTFVPAVGGASPVPAHFLVTDIPVDATTPLAAPGKPYTMRLTLSGYDTTAAQALTVNVRAGQETQVPFVLPKFGTITGDVEGIIGGVSNEVITLCDPQVPQVDLRRMPQRQGRGVSCRRVGEPGGRRRLELRCDADRRRFCQPLHDLRTGGLLQAERHPPSVRAADVHRQRGAG